MLGKNNHQRVLKLNTKSYYKSYKSGNHWVFACMTTLAVTTGIFLGGHTVQAETAPVTDTTTAVASAAGTDTEQPAATSSTATSSVAASSAEADASAAASSATGSTASVVASSAATSATPASSAAAQATTPNTDSVAHSAAPASGTAPKQFASTVTPPVNPSAASDSVAPTSHAAPAVVASPATDDTIVTIDSATSSAAPVATTPTTLPTAQQVVVNTTQQTATIRGEIDDASLKALKNQLATNGVATITAVSDVVSGTLVIPSNRGNQTVAVSGEAGSQVTVTVPEIAGYQADLATVQATIATDGGITTADTVTYVTKKATINFINDIMVHFGRSAETFTTVNVTGKPGDTVTYTVDSTLIYAGVNEVLLTPATMTTTIQANGDVQFDTIYLGQRLEVDYYLNGVKQGEDNLTFSTPDIDAAGDNYVGNLPVSYETWGDQQLTGNAEAANEALLTNNQTQLAALLAANPNATLATIDPVAMNKGAWVNPLMVVQLVDAAQPVTNYVVLATNLGDKVVRNVTGNVGETVAVAVPAIDGYLADKTTVNATVQADGHITTADFVNYTDYIEVPVNYYQSIAGYPTLIGRGTYNVKIGEDNATTLAHLAQEKAGSYTIDTVYYLGDSQQLTSGTALSTITGINVMVTPQEIASTYENTRTIHYVLAAGDQLAPGITLPADVTETIHYDVLTNAVTGAAVYTPRNANVETTDIEQFTLVNTPILTGYMADQASVAAGTIPMITGDLPDVPDVTVTYHANSVTADVHFSTNQGAKTVTHITGKVGSSVQVTVPPVTGYDADPATINATVNPDGTITTTDTVVYSPSAETATIHFVSQNGTPMFADQTYNGFYGDDYTVVLPTLSSQQQLAFDWNTAMTQWTFAATGNDRTYTLTPKTTTVTTGLNDMATQVGTVSGQIDGTIQRTNSNLTQLVANSNVLSDADLTTLLTQGYLYTQTDTTGTGTAKVVQTYHLAPKTTANGNVLNTLQFNLSATINGETTTQTINVPLMAGSLLRLLDVEDTAYQAATNRISAVYQTYVQTQLNAFAAQFALYNGLDEAATIVTMTSAKQTITETGTEIMARNTDPNRTLAQAILTEMVPQAVDTANTMLVKGTTVDAYNAAYQALAQKIDTYMTFNLVLTPVTASVTIPSNLGAQVVPNISGKIGATVTVKVPAVQGYTPDKTTVQATVNANGTITTADSVIYTPNEVTADVTISSNLGEKVVANVTGKVGETVTVNVPTVVGYTPDKSTVQAMVNADGTITTAEQVNYTPNEVTADVTIPSNLGNQVVSSVTGKVGETVTVNTPAVTGYTADKSTVQAMVNADGTITTDATVNYTANEVTADVTIPSNLGEKVVANVTGKVGETVTVNVPAVAGYTSDKATVQATVNADGTIATDDTVNYTPNEVTADVTISSNLGDKVVANVTGKVGEMVTVKVPVVAGYTPDKPTVHATVNTDGTITTAEQVNYTPNGVTADVTIPSNLGNQVVSSVTGKVGEIVTVNVPSLTGYTPDKTTVQAIVNADGTITTDATVNYTPNEVTADVTIPSNLGDKVVSSVTGKVGETVTVKVPVVAGYTPDKPTVQATVSTDGTITTAEKVNYTPNKVTADVTIPSNLGDKVVANITGKMGETVTVNVPTVTGYTADKPTVQATVNADGTIITTEKVNYTPNEVTADVTIPSNLGDKVVANITGKMGETVTVNVPTVTGYTADKPTVQATVNADGTITTDATVNYTANEITADVTIPSNLGDKVVSSVTGKVGEMVTVKVPSVLGYTPDKLTVQATVNTDGTITTAEKVNYTANEVTADVTIPSNLGDKVVPNVTGKVGETVTVKVPVVAGYTADRTTVQAIVNPDGTITTTETVTYQKAAVAKPTVPTIKDDTPQSNSGATTTPTATVTPAVTTQPVITAQQVKNTIMPTVMTQSAGQTTLPQTGDHVQTGLTIAGLTILGTIGLLGTTQLYKRKDGDSHEI